MSSGTRVDPNAGRNIIKGASGQLVTTNPGEKIARLGMTPRQQELNRRWSYYTCNQYDARNVDWDGSSHVHGVEREAIASAGFLPPGFYDAGGSSFPLKFRRPSAAYHMARVVTDRFTGLLFSERRHPQLRVDGDPDTEDFMHALAEQARLWPAMIQARTYGGATGSVCVGFQFIDGRPVVEVHDPRWIYPDFEDRSALRLRSFDKRYMYPQEMRDPETGLWVEVWFWYRRVVTPEQDVLFQPAPVGDGEEPEWIPQAVVNHGLGFCPAVWVQNVPVLDDVDGESDCHGVYDMIEEIDKLLAQASRGTVMNCDPTLVLVTEAQLAEIRKGSDNAIKLPPQSSAQYLEINGSGPTAAREMAEQLRKYVLEVTKCVLEQPDNPGAKTATEVERLYSSMIAQADVLREQYGERCVKPLLEMMVKAAKQLDQPREEDGLMVREQLRLPPAVIRGDDGRPAGFRPRKLGPGGEVKLQWPGYFEPSLQDATQAVQAAAAAKAALLVDDEHAAKFVADFFRVEDIPAMVKALKDTAAQKEAAMIQAAIAPADEGGHPYGKK